MGKEGTTIMRYVCTKCGNIQETLNNYKNDLGCFVSISLQIIFILYLGSLFFDRAFSDNFTVNPFDWLFWFCAFFYCFNCALDKNACRKCLCRNCVIPLDTQEDTKTDTSGNSESQKFESIEETDPDMERWLKIRGIKRK